MIRRLFVLGTVLGALLLRCCQPVWAQCQPTNQPTLDFSLSKTVDPDQVPFAAVTINFSLPDGSNPFHRGTAGVGTNLLLNWHSWNVASPPTIYYRYDDQNSWTLFWFQPTTNSGSWQTYLPDNNLYTRAAGRPVHFLIVGKEKQGSGSFTLTTQDTAQITVTNSGVGISSSDNTPYNSYLMVSLNYNGTPNIPYQTICPNAAEKDMLPTAQLNLSNTTSGENRNGVSFQGATTVVGQPVSATAYDYISFLPSVDGFPGDIIVTGAGGFVYCSAIGDFWQGFQDFKATVEAALTFSQVTGFVGQNASLRNWCNLNDIPPDYNPNILLNAQPGATYAWGAALCLNSTWSSGFWLCTPGISYSLTGTYTRKPCTHNPPPY